jgi:type I restriction enzyme R subunit
MEEAAPRFLSLLRHNFDDRDIDGLIEHFRDPERRKSFFKEYKEIEMLYEIISPDAFLRPFIEEYTSLSAIYDVVRKAYTKKIHVDRDFQKKTNELVQKHIGTTLRAAENQYLAVDKSTLESISMKISGKATKVINLIKAIGKEADANSGDPFLVAMAERARAVQEAFEERQSSTEKALEDLVAEIRKNEQRKKKQTEMGLDGLSYFLLCKLADDGIANPESVSARIRDAFIRHPGWKSGEAELRELRKEVTFAVLAEEDDLNKATATVESLFLLLEKAFRK